jgi:ABC-type dipeptide/oligopeptide/nickel transport system ATPase subunit
VIHAAPIHEPLLRVKGLQKLFPIRRGFWKRTVGHVRAVDGVNFHIDEGETLGLVGESGCGKTTTARCIVRAIEPTAGQIHMRVRDGAAVDVGALGRKELRALRREMQMIFQDPFASLNPRMTLLDLVGEPLYVHGVRRRREREERVAELLRRVGLRPEYMRRFPHAFSGGERQRIGIARALALRPRLVVADEPVSALDVSVQAQILNLLQDLQAEFRLTYRGPRPQRGAPHQRSGRGDVRRPHRGARRNRADLHRAETPVHVGPLVRGARARSPRALEADHPPGRGGESCFASDRLLLPSPLPARDRGVPDAGAGLAGDRARPLRGLPPRRRATARRRGVTREPGSASEETAMSETIEVLNPMGFPPAVDGKALAPRLPTLDGRTVYLVDCRFDDSDIFLEQMRAWLAEHLPGAQAVVKRISSVYLNDDPATWEEIRTKGHAAVVGVGH